ncbi:MAG: DUF998 domain-containing protein [Bauldia sp.]
MVRRWLLVAGILAPVVYAAAVIVGAAATPGYSHFGNTISELVAVGAPHKAIVDPILMASCVLGFVYGLDLSSTWRRIAPSLRPAAVGVAAIGLVGFAILWFPVDGRPLPRPLPEHIHIALTGLLLLLMAATLFLFARGTRAVPGWSGLSRYAAATLVVVVAAGVLTAIGEPNNWPALGLIERLAIGPYLVWMAVAAVATLRGELRGRCWDQLQPLRG